MAAPAVLGDFELRREIGRGGMGTVYEAWQHSLRRVIALKVLASHVSASPKAVLRFQREAQAAAKLHHTHIVPIFAQGEIDGIHYYAMEFIAGKSLSAIISEQRRTEVPDTIASDLADTVLLPRGQPGLERTAAHHTEDQASAEASDSTPSPAKTMSARTTRVSAERCNTIAQHIASIADALDYAHTEGVIHRDVKPHNLIMGNDDRMRIADFGLARLSEQPGVTVTGEMIGSPLYMSPEQISGDPAGVDHRADIYSLGATMYEWLTLVPPYPGETREQVISRILGSEPPPLRAIDPDIPVDLETITLKAIERDPDRRYQAAGELRDDLRRFLASRPIVARRAGLPTRTLRFVSRHQVASLAALVVIVAASLGWAVHLNRKKAEAERVAAAHASAAAVEAAAAATETEQKNEMLLNWLKTLQGGPAGLAEAAIPVVGDLVSPNPTDSEGDTGQTDAVVPVVGTTTAIAHRLALQFYLGVKPPDWPREPTGPDDEQALHLNEAVASWAAGNLKGACGLVDSYLEVFPNDFEAWQMHTILTAQSGKYEEMAKDAERLKEIAEHATGLSRSPGYQTRAYMWRGLADLFLDLPARSMPYLNRAALLGGHPLYAKVLRGLAWTQNGRPTPAVTDFDSVLRDARLTQGSPVLVLALLGRASALLASGSFEEAKQSATEVLAVAFDDPDALAIRGDCHAALGNYAAAARDYQAAMTSFGQTPTLLAKWGGTQMALHQRSLTESEEAGTQDQPESTIGPDTPDPDAERSRGPFLDRFFRKGRPRPQGGTDGLSLDRPSFRLPLPYRP